jgi:formylglycine-generating enzyme required for sulfatase activity
MLRAVLQLFIALSVTVCAGPAAFADKRVALVIGNSSYANAGILSNPARDAKAVAAALRGMGFGVTERYNLSKQQFDDVLKSFGDAAAGADWALVYFAGHGIGVGGETFLLPTDAALARAEHVDDEAISLGRVRAKAGGAKTLRLVILDSCRNNPFAARMAAVGSKRAISRGLARPSEPESGELIAYATRENDVADDGAGAEHSPFTSAFLQHVAEPGLELNFLFRRIRSSVVKGTGGGQDPAIYASLSDAQLFFVPPKAEGQPPAGPQAPLSEAAQAWSKIEGLKDAAVFEAFRRQYGAANPLYDTLASQKITELKRSQAGPWEKYASPGSQGGRTEAEKLKETQTAINAPPKPVAHPADGACNDLLVSVAMGKSPCIKPGSGESFKDCRECPEMVIVPAGSFMMGSPESEPDRSRGEGPQHKVTIPKPFAAGKFTVTFSEWDACLAGGGCGRNKPDDRGWGRGDRPVINITWEEAQAYVKWLRAKTGKTYRLMTEAEFEYTARAGTTTPFWWGSSIAPDRANYNDSASPYINSSVGTTLPVQSFKPNPWGLYQVHGNIWTWTEDCYEDSYKDAPTDGSAKTALDCARRSLRGGSFGYRAEYLRVARRLGFSPDVRLSGVGFRLARTM